MEPTITTAQKGVKKEVPNLSIKEENLGQFQDRQNQINQSYQGSEFQEDESPIQQEKTKNHQFQMEMKNIGINYSQTNINKTQFVNNISKALGNFFNPFINALANRQRSLCMKMGLVVQNEEKINKNQHTSHMQQEAKIQSSNHSENKKLSKNHNSKNIQPNQQKKGNKKNLTQKQEQNQIKGLKQNKRRIIRKIVRKPALVRRDHEQKVLVKQMQQNFDCKLKNNRLYMKGMPKKPVSSFFFFFKQYSKKIQEQNEKLETSKQLTYGSALAKRISQRWRQMTNEQKIPYKLLSQTTRQAYQRSMNEFKSKNKEVFDNFKKIKRLKANETRRIKIQRETQSNQFQQIEVQQNEGNDKVNNEVDQSGNKSVQIQLQSEEQLPIMVAEDDEEKSNKRRAPQRNQRLKFKSIHKPKSPSPSFFFFYNEKKVDISKEHNVTRGAKITQIASEMWKKMSEQQKNPYELMANQRRKQYYEQMKRFQVDHPQQWAKMIAHRRRVTGSQFLKKNSQSRARQLLKNSVDHDEQENSESIEEQSHQIDSLEGTVIKKNQKNEHSVEDNQEKVTLEVKKYQEKNKKSIQEVKNPQVKQTPTSRRKPVRRNPPPKIEKDEQNLEKDDDQKQDTEKKESHRPKAPISSFFMFYKENNSTLAQQFQQKNGGKLVQFASQIWKNMNQTEKKPYEIQAAQSRQNYYKEMQSYKKNYPEQIKQRRIDLKKKHENQALNEKTKRNRRKNQSQDEVKKQTVDKSDQIKLQESK